MTTKLLDPLERYALFLATHSTSGAGCPASCEGGALFLPEAFRALVSRELVEFQDPRYVATEKGMRMADALPGWVKNRSLVRASLPKGFIIDDFGRAVQLRA